MTEGGHGEEPLTPDGEATVARMLADAAGPLRMPDDVATRLDGVLAGLERERSATTGAEVVELRVRRRWPRVLVAAAAVVVGGYAVGTVATQGTLSGSDDGMSAASDSAGADGGSSRDEQPGATSQEDSGGDSAAEEPPDELTAPEAASGQGTDGGSDTGSEQSTDAMVLRTVQLRSDRFDVGVRRALRVLETHPHRTSLLKGFAAGGTTCPTPELGRRDRYLPVRYDGEEAVLVARPEREGRVEVIVWSCAGDELDSTLVRP